VPPKQDTLYQNILWPESLLELKDAGFDTGMNVINDYLSKWTPEIATKNYRMSLKHLDWRWRIKEISDYFNINSEILDFELNEIRKILEN